MNKKQTKRIEKLFLENNIPKYVRCYDDGKTFDLYTVVFTGRYRKSIQEGFCYVMMSEHPFHPQGFGQHGEHDYHIDVNKWGYAPTIGRKNHLGTRISFEDLPTDCKKLIISDYKDLWEIDKT